jgi:endonuclease/exonuclease/phosphatase family metal-dependent hydrolase
MPLRALTWNLFHGRDFPPDPDLFTWRSRLLRVTERNTTHAQVNRELLAEFASVLAGAEWDVALLQECPPRWADELTAECDAQPHLVLTSRNSFARIRATLARLNPDLIASNEGGCNLTLVRASAGEVVERRELELRPGPDPERRTMAFTRMNGAAGPLCVANLHASAGRRRRAYAEEEVRLAASSADGWAGDSPLLFGGDLNLRPDDSELYAELEGRHGLRGPTAPNSLDHLLARGLTPTSLPAPWPAEQRELPFDHRRIRLSDHAPVEAWFDRTPHPPG